MNSSAHSIERAKISAQKLDQFDRGGSLSMKALVFHGVGFIRIDDVAEPQVRKAGVVSVIGVYSSDGEVLSHRFSDEQV